jgi:hypothetical protein
VLLIVAAAVLALVAMPASSYAASTKVTDAASSKVVEQPAAATDTSYVLAFGYQGKDICGTALACDWNGNAINDETFVIAPDRTIWHAWPNSGGWYQMPNNGKADDTHNCYINGNGQRQVEVSVIGSGVWYSYYSGGWRGWYRY